MTFYYSLILLTMDNSTHSVSFDILSLGNIPFSFRVQETLATFQSRYAS